MGDVYKRQFFVLSLSFSIAATTTSFVLEMLFAWMSSCFITSKSVSYTHLRIRSLTRRKFVQNDICLKCGEIKFDTIKREAYAKEEPVPLTRKEAIGNSWDRNSRPLQRMCNPICWWIINPIWSGIGLPPWYSR